MVDFKWFRLDINPEPWAIGDLSVGRRGGKFFPIVGRNQQLWHYQQAVKGELGDPGLFIEGPIEAEFYFWRRRDDYETHQARTHRKHEADVTNLQKGLEDALQGVLFKNDKDMRDIRSVMVEQGPHVHPMIILGIRPGEGRVQMRPSVSLLASEVEEEPHNEHGFDSEF